MAIESTCSGCGKLLSVGDEHAGRRARCPACGQIYTIPSPNAAPTSAPTDGPPPPPTPTSDSFAETTAGSSPTAPVNSDQYWMRSTDGTDYGPVDRVTLNRWFNEGRVGPGYMIRQSETGNWQGAEAFKPSAPLAGMPNMPSSGNPYATASTVTNAPGYGQMYPKPDQSGLVLAFGILSWFLCPIFGIVAWVMGNSGLRDIQLGLVDPANKGLMQAGYYLGMVNVLLYVLCGGGYFVFIALMILLGAVA